MANMGYCRFQNTYRDLKDCADHIDDDVSEDEEKFRKWLIDLCRGICEDAGMEVSE